MDFRAFQNPISQKNLHILGILIMLILLLNILYALFIFPDKVLMTGTALSTILVILYYSGIFKKVSVEIMIANGILLFYFSSFVMLYPLLMPNEGDQLVKALNSGKTDEIPKVYVYGNIRTASNIRVHSHHQLDVVSMDTVYTLPEEPDAFLVFTKKEQEFLNLQGYKIIKGSEDWSRLPAEKFPAVLQPFVIKLPGRAVRYLPAPPQTRTSGFPAYGSSKIGFAVKNE